MMEETKETRTLGDYPLYQQKIEAKVKGLIDMLFSINNSYDAEETFSCIIDNTLEYRIYNQGQQVSSSFENYDHSIIVNAKNRSLVLHHNKDHKTGQDEDSLSIFTTSSNLQNGDLYHHFELSLIPNQVFYVREIRDNISYSGDDIIPLERIDLEKGFDSRTDISLINSYFKALDTAYKDTKKVLDYVEASKK